ncbi:unnamed protein product [Bursaphelenchus okinawaensis]|uniref:Solute-binding protein family 3/N-terminal domain-containing protein n=1 Tax=Bursaphelenchus okinawaensis TaxID=465554 RepID=A0A811K0Y6_9BILA|nr:unnamed protein product [Bursaphelenchus okinawaensis]CAG9089565.1 unnamed protein product [Bursaphelenchus okinawaensis]
MNITTLRVLYTGGLPALNTDCFNAPVISPRKGCMFPGLHVEIIKLIATRLGLKIEPHYHPSEQPVVGHVVDGIPNGLMQLINNGTVDTMALAVGPDDERRLFFDFTEPVYYSLSRVLINVPSSDWHSYTAFFESYHFSAWICIIFALMLQCGFCMVVNRVESFVRKRESHRSVADLVWKIVRLQLLQASSVENNLVAGRISFFIFSLVQCTVIMGVLSSYIFSNLVRPEDPVPFKTFSQFTSLIADGTLHMVEVTKASIFYETVVNSNATDFSELRNALESNPLRLGKDIDDVMDMLDKPGAVIIRYVG